MKPRTLLRLFAAALVPASALTSACGDDDNAPLAGADGGTTDATTADVTSGADASQDADADAPMPSIDSGGCSWSQRDGGPTTGPDGAVLEEPDSGVVAESDAGPAEWSDAGYPSDYCMHACGFISTNSGTCKPAPGGKLWCLYCGFGRRPQGFTDATRFADDLGSRYAEMARLEAASVAAFRTLARELAFHRAPRRLVRAAERAARDEIRHARATAALARRHGGHVVFADIPRPPIRDLEAIAKENAVEGCVHETWGALLASYEARHASDPVARAVMKRIARDETQHAALAWQIAAWAESRLDRAARARIVRTRRDASERLLASADAEHRSLLAHIDAALWSPVTAAAA